MEFIRFQHKMLGNTKMSWIYIYQDLFIIRAHFEFTKHYFFKKKIIKMMEEGTMQKYSYFDFLHF
jgi:hypothetical protein